MTALRFRDATPGDHAAFVSLFRELGVDDAVPSEARYSAEIQPTTMFAERDGGIVGYAYHRVLADAAHLAHLVAAPTARRSGVGRALIAATRERVARGGCRSLTLNVRPENTAAVALYEACGFRPIFRSRALRFAWSAFDALHAPALPAKDIDAAEDARLEDLAGLAAGTLAAHRDRTGRVLRVIEEADGVCVAVFDVDFPGTYPFFATSGRHALAMLRALRPFARPSDAVVNMALEAQHDIADALIAAGATLRFETIRMRAEIA